MPLTMTAADLLTVRRRTSATTDELSDAVIDALYISTTMGQSDLDRTTYYSALELAGVLAVLVDKSNEVDSLSVRSSQRFDHLMDKILPLWATITGIGMGAGMGSSSTYTYRADSLQAEEPTYERGTATLGWDDE